uniref:Reverse transcriptase domain-containing protein n=1 Tax=Tanacetum cinerariifolium TaxID=118510 RepID=A0A6L2KUB7_TANCI|nr:hypothetical protein [Tanacetum cinerariifolium]
MLLATMRTFMREMMRILSDRTSGRGVVIDISRPLSRVVTGATVRITTVMGLTSEVVVTTTIAATTTTLAVTTGIPVMDVTKETGVISPTDLPILALSSPGVPLRATPIQYALLVDVDTKESVVELQNTILRSIVIPIELSLVTFMHLSIPITVPYRENPCRSFQLYKHVPYYIMAVKGYLQFARLSSTSSLFQGQIPSPRLLTAWLQ